MGHNIKHSIKKRVEETMVETVLTVWTITTDHYSTFTSPNFHDQCVS